MITMEMIGKVRRMKLREQLSYSEIAKRTGLSCNTVKACPNFAKHLDGAASGVLVA